jgi:hypothetical protein
MPVPQPFWVPWVDIDPSLRHGGIPGELEGQFVGPRFGDNPTTRNPDMKRMFTVLSDATAAISMTPGAEVEGEPSRNDVDLIFRATNKCFERLADRITTSANTIFQWDHATPPSDRFRVRPVRFPLRNSIIHDVVFMFLGTMGQCAEGNANALHSSIDPRTGRMIFRPLWKIKAQLMKDYFDKEVAGELSPEEMTELFREIENAPPAVTDPGTTATKPSKEAVTEALTGVDVMKWMPDEPDWALFGQKVDSIFEAASLFQPEGAIGTTEDVAPDRPGADAPLSTSGLS